MENPFLLKLYTFLIICYSLIILLLDYILPVGTAVGVLYALIVFSSSFVLRSSRSLLWVLCLCSFFLILGCFISEGAGEGWVKILNAGLNLAVVWIGGFMGIFSNNATINEKASNTRFQLAIEAAPNAMIIVNTTGMITFANRQVERLFGYGREELIGLNVDQLVPTKFRGQHPQSRSLFLKDPKTRTMGAGRDLYGLKKDGTEVPVEIGLTPLNTREGIFVISAIIDITERKKSQRALELKALDLERANEELSQFAYRTSHDLKAPLITIQGLASYVEKDFASGKMEEAKRNLTKIISQSKKLERLVTDILSLTKADLSDIGEEDLDFKVMIEDIKERLADLISENKVKILTEVSAGKLYQMQKSRITQILENLISNSVKYCNPRKNERFVNVRILDDNRGGSLIEVEDNGLGIPQQHQNELFKMFKRFHPNVAYGSGLGMSIVKKHVDKMGGRIRINSTENGTTIQMSFPGKV